ncbi:MAG: acyl-CoA dehydrogenase family protein [Pigmentiphaga sp.]|nr:acyl-CoA dehydrogenase family protein [Pigmentiphaga sp.]
MQPVPVPHVDAESFQDFLGTVRRFVDEVLIPRERELEETGVIPAAVAASMRELGLCGLSIHPDYGGLGLSLSQELALHEVLSEAAQGFRYVYGSNVGIGSRGLALDGTEAQKARYLPRLASGELVASFCLTEPEAGSDAASLITRAERGPGPDGDDGYRLTGTKRFITNADVAGLFTVMARSGGAPGARGISAFLVPRETPGVRVGKPERKLGHRGGNVCDVTFDGAWVPADALLGGVEGKGFATAMRTLDSGRLSVAANCLGQMRRAIDEAARYALQRRQFGQAVADFQLVQALLADSETDWAAARSLVYDAGRAYDTGAEVQRLAACAKYFASEALGRVADRCLQVLGGAGYIADYPLERIFRDARVARIYEGTSQIMQLVIARQLLKSYE